MSDFPRSDSPPWQVAVVAFERISPFHLSVPCVVFGDRHPGCPACTFTVCAVEPGVLPSTAGFGIAVAHDLQVLTTADLVIVPSWRDPDERPPAPLLAALQAAHARGATVVGLCLGAYVLAEAGLLVGRRATTHWAYARDFATRYPATAVDAGVLYVDDDRVVTSAGTAAGLDCCLYLLRQRWGTDVANHVARRLVIAPHRQGGQAQFIEQPLPDTAASSRLAGVLDWVRAHLTEAHTVDTLAARVSLSRRSFTRHFRRLTGMSLVPWLLGERLAYAQRLLEGSDASVERVAGQAGFGSVEALRLHFRRQFGLSPTAWRHQFRR